MPRVKILRLHFSEGRHYNGKPLHEAIVGKCIEMHIAGATVFRGLEGYGETAEIHRRHMMGHDQPIVIVVIDSAERIAELLPAVKGMMDTGMIALSDGEAVRVERASAS